MFFELDKVDKIIKRFQSYYPKGGDFSESAFDISDRKEKASILKFLVTEGILEPWGDEGKHIITAKGRDMTADTGGIKGYLELKQLEVEENYKRKVLRKQMQKKEAKLAKSKNWISRLFGNKL